MPSARTRRLTLAVALVATAAGAADPPADHWAWRVPVRPHGPTTVPSPSRLGWDPIDAFVVARLHAAGLGLAPRADRATLIRRATYDLTGLPPTPEDVDAFLNDHAPDAWGKVI